ncbi:MAG: response regulator [Candidatus Omnitrophica bacterium]|nr:response regulator [Candidatus Omnitrophota bacterium]
MEKLLVIDDKAFLRDIIKQAFPEFEVIYASSGKEGLKNISDGGIAIVLLDIKMPDMDGLEVLKIIKADEQNKEIPVIMISAYGDHDTVQSSLDMGASDFISKPFDIRAIKSVIQRSLGM